MGSDAEIYIFDHNKFIEECVPEFHKLLNGQQSAEWFGSHHKAYMVDVWETIQTYTKDHRTNISDHCEILAEDFTYIGPYFNDHVFDEGFHYHNFERLYGPEARFCTSETCPEAAYACPFHTTRQGSSAIMQDLNILFIEIIGNHCLGARQFVGRSMTPFKFYTILKSLDDERKEKLKSYLYKLGSRGKVIGYAWGNSDGIHGWLDEHETEAFIQLLTELDLPEYELSLEMLGDINYANAYRGYLDHPSCYREDFFKEAPVPEVLRMVQDTPWETLALSFLRTIGTLAMEERKGILWGNDMSFGTKWD